MILDDEFFEIWIDTITNNLLRFLLQRHSFDKDSNLLKEIWCPTTRATVASKALDGSIMLTLSMNEIHITIVHIMVARDMLKDKEYNNTTR